MHLKYRCKTLSCLWVYKLQYKTNPSFHLSYNFCAKHFLTIFVPLLIVIFPYLGTVCPVMNGSYAKGRFFGTNYDDLNQFILLVQSSLGNYWTTYLYENNFFVLIFLFIHRNSRNIFVKFPTPMGISEVSN